MREVGQLLRHSFFFNSTKKMCSLQRENWKNFGVALVLITVCISWVVFYFGVRSDVVSQNIERKLEKISTEIILQYFYLHELFSSVKANSPSVLPK